MMTADILGDALDNMAETYCALGRAHGNTDDIEGPGFRGVVSETNHPICNFAVSDGRSTLPIRQAVMSKCFQLYVGSETLNQEPSEALFKVGFVRSATLAMMMAYPQEVVDDSDVCILPMDTRESREIVADLMVSVFFPDSTPVAKETIALCTVGAASLELYGAWSTFSHKTYRTVLGGLLLSQADKAIGLYNFCVKRDVQGQGIGKKIAINVLKLAALQKKAVYLQCEPKLAGWYERFGFKTIGSVDIYGIAS